MIKKKIYTHIWKQTVTYKIPLVTHLFSKVALCMKCGIYLNIESFTLIWIYFYISVFKLMFDEVIKYFKN